MAFLLKDNQNNVWSVSVNSTDGSIQTIQVPSQPALAPSSFIVHDDQGNSWQLTITSSDGSIIATEVPNAAVFAFDNPNCTLTVQSVVNWARTQNKLVPLIGVGGFSQTEPALSIANNVMKAILMKPYNWKWNRVEWIPPTPTFATVAFQQDYVMAAIDALQIGWIEHAELEDSTSTQPIPYRNPLTVARELNITSDYGNPEKISYKFDATFNGWFRIWPIPTTQIWNIYVTYQVRPPQILTLPQTWAPIPDTMDYVIRQGFLAFTKRHAGDDQGWLREYQIFKQMLDEAMGYTDSELRDETFYPNRPVLLG